MAAKRIHGSCHFLHGFILPLLNTGLDSLNKRAHLFRHRFFTRFAVGKDFFQLLRHPFARAFAFCANTGYGLLQAAQHLIHPCLHLLLTAFHFA